MNDQEFERLYAGVIETLEAGLEANDIDCERCSGEVLEIDLGSDGKAVLNRHTPLQEIWLASRRGAFHYRHDGIEWRDTKSGRALHEQLTEWLGVDL